jgi:hypothetical protein
MTLHCELSPYLKYDESLMLIANLALLLIPELNYFKTCTLAVQCRLTFSVVSEHRCKMLGMTNLLFLLCPFLAVQQYWRLRIKSTVWT